MPKNNGLIFGAAFIIVMILFFVFEFSMRAGRLRYAVLAFFSSVSLFIGICISGDALKRGWAVSAVVIGALGIIASTYLIIHKVRKK